MNRKGRTIKYARLCELPATTRCSTAYARCEAGAGFLIAERQQGPGAPADPEYAMWMGRQDQNVVLFTK